MTPIEIFYSRIKTAVPKSLVKAVGRGLTRSPLHGALAGAGFGATRAVLNKQPEESALQAGILGGVGGAVIGGAAAGLGRAYRDARLLNPELGTGRAIGATAGRAAEAVKRFGRRQLHGLTGRGSSGRGMEEAQRKIELVRARMIDDAANQELSPVRLKAYHKQISDLRTQGRYGDIAEAAGITSIPGVVRGLAQNPKKTTKALGREMAGGSGLGLIAPVAFAAPELARGDESSTGGRTLGQKFTRLGTTMAGGTLTSGLPIVPQLVAGGAIDTAGNYLTRRR